MAADSPAMPLPTTSTSTSDEKLTSGLSKTRGPSSSVGAAGASGDGTAPDEQAAKRQSELLAQLNTAIADYKMAVEGGGASGGTSASYSVVTLTSGQTLALGVGCEVMLRVGTATLAANTDPGLIDVSTGGTLNNGGALTANHLYMATIADRTVQATAATVKLLVRGEYTVS